MLSTRDPRADPLCVITLPFVSRLQTLPCDKVFVEALDKCFENVCELDLIFHSDKVSEMSAPAIPPKNRPSSSGKG